MASLLHREIFTWPPVDAFTPGSKLEPNDIGFDTIEHDVDTEILNMVREAKEQGKDEPFCVFDLGTVVERYHLWCRAFPTIQPFYAVKAYDDPVVIKLLSELGAGFDCASKREIEIAVGLGVKPDNIVFANPVKLPSHISHAAETGVSLMTFDTQEELVKIKKCHPHSRLLLRICPLPSNQAEMDLKMFGCILDSVPGIISMAKHLNLTLVGVCFHIGYGCCDPMIFVRQINTAKMVFDIALENGIQMSILDIGGGFFGTKEAEDVLLKMKDPINSALKAFQNVKVISEPGRFFVQSALTMATSVIGTCPGTYGTLVRSESVMSASAFGIPNRHTSMRCFVDFTYEPKLALREPHSEETYDQNLRGPTCAPHDNIPCRNLPQLQLGDWLVFEDVGAYTVTASTAFNGFPKPPIRRVMKRELWESLTNEVYKGNEIPENNL